MNVQVRKFFTQSSQCIVHDTIGTKVVFIPYVLQDLIARKGDTFVFDKHHQQIEFFGRQFDLDIVGIDLALYFVQLIAIDRDPIGVFFICSLDNIVDT